MEVETQSCVRTTTPGLRQSHSAAAVRARQRFRHVVELVWPWAGRDIGCGSSRIIGALPPGASRLTFCYGSCGDRRFGAHLVNASAFTAVSGFVLPCVLCSQVIEHVPKSPRLTELVPSSNWWAAGSGTPDYANWEWVVTEKLYGFFAPGAYADEHIAHYTREELVGYFESLGFRHEATRYILRGELILAFRKPQL